MTLIMATDTTEGVIVTSEGDTGSQHLLSTDTTSVTSLWIVLQLATVICVLLVTKRLFSKKKNLPPGPRGWPVIGSLLLLEPRVHRSFTALAEKYGPIMHMRLGVWDAVVISGVKEVEEMFKSRDAEFGNRPRKTILRLFARYVGFNGQTIVFHRSPPRVKALRKVCLTQLLSPTTLSTFTKVRMEEINRLIEVIAAEADKRAPVKLRECVYEANANVMTELLFGKRIFGGDQPVDPELMAFRNLSHDMAIVAGSMNIAEMIPALEWLDPAGLLPKLKDVQVRMANVSGRIVEEHKQARGGKDPKQNKDFTDILLDQEGENKLADDEVKGVLMDLMFGGGETTPTFIEWTYGELLNTPKVYRKLQEEIDSVVGSSRAVEESDVRNMPFLDAVVKEIFRLHPVLPLLVPRTNDLATTLGGYDIPQDTALFVNSWAIGRDPSIWDKPLEFNPDRFLAGAAHSKVTTSGQSFELMPFGSGRRMCPGNNFASLMVKLTIASMMHAFDWTPSPGQSFENISFEEQEGMVVRLQESIVAVPNARPNVKYYHS